MTPRTNIYCKTCGDRLTKENMRSHKSDRPGYIHPTCKACLSEKRYPKHLRKDHYFSVKTSMQSEYQ